MNQALHETVIGSRSEATRSVGAGQPLRLRVVRGPLLRHENEAILREYNQLKLSEIPLHEFLRWVNDSPDGPAWHAILETYAQEIVGHQCLIPLRASYKGRPILAAKSEYTFIKEDFRATKIRGFEDSRRPTHIVAAHQLFQHCHREGWGPFLISAIPALQRWGRTNGCEPTNFQGWECLLVLQPWKAATRTPNLLRWQRASLGLTGLAQRVGWSSALFFSQGVDGIRPVSLAEGVLAEKNDFLSFFEDAESLRWRYPSEKYRQFALQEDDGQYVIVKAGQNDAYVRVCQYRLDSNQPSPALISRLVRLAQEQKAIGLRWALYGQGEASRNAVWRMRRLGFLCVRRVRTLLIHAKDREEFLNADRWNMVDSMFSFHP